MGRKICGKTLDIYGAGMYCKLLRKTDVTLVVVSQGEVRPLDVYGQ